MTATDTTTDSPVEIADHADGLYRLIASNDHKAVGRLWIGVSLVFLVAMAVLAVLTAFERVSLGGIDVFADVPTYFQAWTLVRTSSIFLVVLPLFIGLATVVVPLQVGSPAIAFPRLAAAAFWTWLVGAGIHIASFIADGGLGPAAGTDRDATLLTLSSIGMMVLAVIGASISIATTVIALRPAGMSLMRVPVFSWSMLVAASVWLLSLPVILANLVYAHVDLQGRDPIAFGNPDRLWGDLEWVFQQPQLYACIIPVLGIAAEIVPVMAKVRQANRPVVMALIGVFGVLSFGAWAQHSFSRGADPTFTDGNFIYEEFLYAAFGLAILLPAVGVFGAVMDNLRRGAMPRPNAALVGAIGGLLLLLAASLVGALRVIPFWDALHEDNIMLSSATAQVVLVTAAGVAGALGGLAWWAPKIVGGYVPDGLASGAVIAVALGALLGGTADLVSAFLGQPDISVSDVVEDGVEALNTLAFVGAIVFAVGALGAIGANVAAARSDEVLPDDPWDGHTLEWAAPSPPPAGNFVEAIEPVTSEAPLLDEFEEVG